jgi:LacI family sucrose operon transcriptional repressor
LDYYDYIKKVLAQNPEVDGIFASSDVIAAQILQACTKMGIEVPKQMKLIGFDDVNIASLTTPSITTIKQPIKEMAQIAIDLLISTSEGKLVPKRSVLPVTLIERETT